MSDENIKREEIIALMEVHAKSAEQMVLVAERLKVIAEIQAKISDKLSNGLGKSIGDSVREALESCRETIISEVSPIKSSFNEIKDSILWLKILYGVVGIAIVISSVIVKHMSG